MNFPIHFCLGGKNQWAGCVVFAGDYCHKVTVTTAFCSEPALYPLCHFVLELRCG